MKDLTIPYEAISEAARTTPSVKNTRRRWIAALLFSSAGGVLVGLTGLIISGLRLFGIIKRTSVINHLGTLLIAIAFPLAMFSARAMDKISEIDKQKQ